MEICQVHRFVGKYNIASLTDLNNVFFNRSAYSFTIFLYLNTSSLNLITMETNYSTITCINCKFKTK